MQQMPITGNDFARFLATMQLQQILNSFLAQICVHNLHQSR